jgi:hypothetical protein
MLQLYYGSGSREVQLVSEHNSTVWGLLKRNVVRYLQQKGEKAAAQILADTPFELWHGTNGFGDPFELLYLNTDINTYINFDAQKRTQTANHYRAIADAMSELDNPIRFIVVEISKDEGDAVEIPDLKITSATVERALDDFEILSRGKGGAISGVDRIHTALHAYLETVCDEAGIGHKEDADITALFQLIRDNYPKMRNPTPEVQKILRALAQIVNALNPVRNHMSMAHPNEELLDEREAMLVVNAVKGLLHYLNAKLR